MGYKNTTLIDRLGEIVEKIHLDEVKAIIATLTHISDFKHSLENDLCEENLYTNITKELEKQFQIGHFKISIWTDGIEDVIFTHGESERFECKFSSKVANQTQISIHYCCSKLDNYQQLTLNTYLKELIHLVYIQHVLSNIQKTAALDPLTKLSNRLSFDQEMKTLAPLALREKMKLGFILLNIDRFRAVNDEHGNSFGDKFLQLYAETLKKYVRRSDIVVRFGGGEFLVVLINVDTNERVIEIANKLKDILAQTSLTSPNGDPFKKTVCGGVSVFPDDSEDINTIIKNTEFALSDAKDQGRNKIVRYQPEDENFIELF